MRALFLYVLLASAIGAAAVAASLVLLSSTTGVDRIGRLSPVADLPAVTNTVPPQHPPSEEDAGAGRESDD